MTTTTFDALIAGGSVGGLATAIVLNRIGAQVRVFERSHRQIQTRGAGVVMQPDVEFLLEQIGSSARAVSVPLHTRQRMHRDGSVDGHPAPQLMTSWDTLYRTLRNAIPHVPYRLDSKLVDATITGQRVTAHFADGHNAEGDLLIGADGLGSAARASGDFPGTAQYAGYLAWRGLEPESSLPSHVAAAFQDHFTLFASPGLQFLVYLVPGPHGETETGARRVNWVWYMNVPPHTLEAALRSRSGSTYRSFLPPGEITPDTHHAVRDTAHHKLPPVMADLFEASQVFMQPIYDLPYTRMRAGRTLLVGDAAGTVRPHTASGTSKAFGDAIMLGQALDGWNPETPLPQNRLEIWEHQRSQDLQQIARHGVQLAHSSMLGTPGTPQFLEQLTRPPTD